MKDRKRIKSEYDKKYYEKNKEKIKEKKNSEYTTERRRERQKKYLSNDENRKKLNEYSRIYRLQDKYKSKRNETRRNRMKNDVIYKLHRTISSLIRFSIKRISSSKKGKTIDIIGCSFEDLKLHIESQFETWMTWDNHGKIEFGKFNIGWDIDHIVPISSAINEDEVIKLNHFTNLRPLCSYTNRYIKSDHL